MAIANDLEDCSCCHLHIWNYHRIKSQARARKDHLEVVKRSLHISSKWLAFARHHLEAVRRACKSLL